MEKELQTRLRTATNRLLRLKMLPLEGVDLLPVGEVLTSYELFIRPSGNNKEGLYSCGKIISEFTLLTKRQDVDSRKPVGKQTPSGGFVLDFNKTDNNIFTIAVTNNNSVEVMKLSDTDYNYTWGILRK